MRFVFVNPYTRNRDKVALLVVEVPFWGLVLHPLTSHRTLTRLARQMLDGVPGDQIVSEVMRDPRVGVNRVELDGHRY